MIKTIIFDWKRTLYNPDLQDLIDGSIEVLSFIHSKKTTMLLVGKGGREMHDEVKRLGVVRFFDRVVFEKGEKKLKSFKQLITKNPSETLFVGDRVRSELEIGNMLGCQTVWVKQGEFADEEPLNEVQKPHITVYNLKGLKEYLTAVL